MKSTSLSLFLLLALSVGLSMPASAQTSDGIEALDLNDLSADDCLYIDSCLQVDGSILLADRISYYQSMQLSHESRENYFLALYCADSLISLFDRNNQKEELAAMYQGKSMLHDFVGQYPEALEASQAGLELFVELGDKSGEAASYNDIGVLHYYGENQEIAQDYFQQSFELYQELNDTGGIAMYYNNMANTLFEQDELAKALEMYELAYGYDLILKDVSGQCISLSNIGETYTALEQFNKAEKTLLEALVLAESIDDPWALTNPLRGLGDLYQQTGELHKAIRVLERSVKICDEIDALAEQSQNYELLYTLYKRNGDFKSSLGYYELFSELEDSLFNMEKERMMDEMEVKYQLNDKAKEIELITQDGQINDLEHQQEMDTQKNRELMLFIGLLAFAIVIVFAVRGFILKKKANEQLHSAYHQIEEKNNEILDSIRYAKRIQSAILPQKKEFKKLLPDSFVLYKPKDVVAGDFYWLEERDETILFAAADCTGHGVPGAMVSVVCNNGLNRSVREHGATDPGKILNITRDIVLQEFGKSEEKVNDGMDIAICALGPLSTSGATLKYAGAHNPLWIIRKDATDLEEVKADKQPIGKFENPTPYTTHSITLNRGDTVYVFSDGYADQFGGDKGKKMKTINFKKLLLSISSRTMAEQLSRLDDAFDEWKGEIEQLDDVCVIGVRV